MPPVHHSQWSSQQPPGGLGRWVEKTQRIQGGCLVKEGVCLFLFVCLFRRDVFVLRLVSWSTSGGGMFWKSWGRLLTQSSTGIDRFPFQKPHFDKLLGLGMWGTSDRVLVWDFELGTSPLGGEAAGIPSAAQELGSRSGGRLGWRLGTLEGLVLVDLCGGG